MTASKDSVLFKSEFLYCKTASLILKASIRPANTVYIIIYWMLK